MNDAPVSDFLRQASIQTEDQLTDVSDSSWKDCTYTVRSIVAYIIFYQGGTIDHGTHVSGPVTK